MMTFQQLLGLLASQLGADAAFRDVLFASWLASVEEDRAGEGQGREVSSYPDLLDLIRAHHEIAVHVGKQQTAAACQRLEQHLRNTLHQAATRLHYSVTRNMPLPAQEAAWIGVDLGDFPTGFPPSIDLLAATERYVEVMQDLGYVADHVPHVLPQLTSLLITAGQHEAYLLGEVAHTALVTATLPNELTAWRDAFLTQQQHGQATAVAAYRDALRQTDRRDSAAFARAIDEALPTLRSTTWTVLCDTLAEPPALVLELLIRTPQASGLRALLAWDGARHQADRLDTLLTLRFGEQYQRTPAAWYAWLEHQLEAQTHWQAAVAYWVQRPYSLVQLLHDHLDGPALPTRWRDDARQEIGTTTHTAFLERQRGAMTPEEARLVAAAAPHEGRRPRRALAADALQAVLQGDDVLVTVADSAVEQGLEALGEHLTVDLADSEALPTTPPDQRPAWGQAASLWTTHILPFITDNLVFVLAPSFIFLGLLLLVFTLWEQAAWIRYGVTPLLLVSVAYALCRFGQWLRQQGLAADGPIALIQGIVIFFAPMCQLFVALLAGDRTVAFSIRVLWGIGLAACLFVAWSRLFRMAIQSLYAPMTTVHALTLLFLNALLLLLPVAWLTAPADTQTLPLQGQAILVGGFYSGFVALLWGMHRVFGTLLPMQAWRSRVPPLFYGVTCLGTFVLVWGLTHVRLAWLPAPHTYGPLLVLGGLMAAMLEFRLLQNRQQTGRIGLLSYLGYGCMGLGVLLSLGQEYVRIVALLLASLVWWYQALMRRETRHGQMALVLTTVALSSLGLVRGFPPLVFPYLVLVVALGVYGLAGHLSFPTVAEFARRFSPLYLSLGFIVAVLWQWLAHLPPLPYGVAFAGYGLLALGLGAREDKLLHVHAGMGYLAAALPYLGYADMQRYTLADNTLVFGLAVLGLAWTVGSTLLTNTALRDSRSTVLWQLGILAWCLMLLRVLGGEPLTAVRAAARWQILGGPLLMSGLMLLTGALSRSALPVYLGLSMLVGVEWDLRQYLGVVGRSRSGLSTALVGSGFVLAAWLVQRYRRPHATP